jgi:hypothetical protein
MSVVFPLFERPTKERIGIAIGGDGQWSMVNGGQK